MFVATYDGLFSGSTDVDFVDSFRTESTSCPSSKFNAIADLARRVSSCGEFDGVTSAADFLSASKSLELDEKQSDHKPILQTVPFIAACPCQLTSWTACLLPIAMAFFFIRTT